jgi:hypothetical protein
MAGWVTTTSDRFEPDRERGMVISVVASTSEMFSHKSRLRSRVFLLVSVWKTRFSYREAPPTSSVIARLD